MSDLDPVDIPLTLAQAAAESRNTVTRPRSTRPRGVKRIVQALTSSGVGIARIEIDNATGKTIIITAAAPNASPQDDLDLELEKWEARHSQG